MIANQKEYHVAKAEVRRFEQALSDAGERQDHRDPLLRHVIREGIESQLEELRAEVAEYEAIRDGRVRRLEAPLAGLPEAMIAARIAGGLTQKELGERLGVKEQQIQHYERTRYAAASFTRLMAVCQMLGLEAQVRVLLPVPAAEKRGRGARREPSAAAG